MCEQLDVKCQGDIVETWVMPAQGVAGRSPVVYMVGNAYGVLPYIHTMADVITCHGYAAVFCNFRGQGGSGGTLSVSNATEDLAAVIEVCQAHPAIDVTQQVMLAQCTGTYAALEYLVNRKNRLVKALAIYGLVFMPTKVKQRALMLMAEHKVRWDPDAVDWEYDPCRAISKLRVPTLLTHALDERNLSRSSLHEILTVYSYVRDGQLTLLQQGYDVGEHPRSLFEEWWAVFQTWFDRRLPLRAACSGASGLASAVRGDQ